jgi:hypothetical protein
MLTFNVTGSDKDLRIAGVIDSLRFNVAYSLELQNSLKDLQTDLESINDVDAYEAWVAEVTEVLEAADTVDTITAACQDLMLDTKTGNYYVKVGTKVSKHPVPMDLVDVILESAEKGIDPSPIVKAWIRFMRNPNFSTRKANLFARYITTSVIDAEEVTRLMEEEGFVYEKAVERAQYNDVTITNEGLIVAKKYAKLLTKGWVIDAKTNEAVLEDLYPSVKTVDKFSGEVTVDVKYPEFTEELTFEPPVQGRSGDKFFSGDVEDHIIRVGHKHELDSWSKVNTNDDTTCVKGLHVGGIQYVASYSGLNCQLLDCFVDPSDIGAICGMNSYAGSDGAIRVKAYFIYKATQGRTKGIYHSSKYAAMKDAEWEAYKKEAIDAANEIKAELVDFDVN